MTGMSRYVQFRCRDQREMPEWKLPFGWCRI
jgi:hypothetical protein